MRRWPPLTEGPAGERYSENFASINRNKRSITVDLKDAAQVARLKKLCERADVIIENYRPGVLERLAGAGCRTWRTDRSGEVTVTTDGRSARVVTATEDTTVMLPGGPQ